MKRLIILAGLALILSGGYIVYNRIKKGEVQMKKKKETISLSPVLAENDLTLITVYDNNQYNPELKTGWGFSCLVRFKGKNILFDTGADSSTLLANMEKLAIQPEEVEMIILSHIHGDHVNGLWGILEKNGEIEIYLPASFPNSFREKIKSFGVSFQEIKEGVQIIKGVYSTGELGNSVKEQALVIKTEKGLVILTGCAHPGVVNLAKKAKEIVGERIYLVLGGFHLSGSPDSKIKEIIADLKNLEVKKVAPCHCSGDHARHLFKESFGEDYIENGVGRIIKI
jgi:7,8-dihydropterin-6-yl-methyl-4-(beta-D-ribofuranosyl)aminobenzene 5'-phosphate synthase